MVHVIPKNEEHIEYTTCDCFPFIVKHEGELVCCHQSFEGMELINGGFEKDKQYDKSVRDGKNLKEGDVVVDLNNYYYAVYQGGFMMKTNEDIDLVKDIKLEPNYLFLIGNLFENLELRHDFFHGKVKESYIYNYIKK